MVRYTLWERKFHRTKVQGSESSLELSFPVAKVPGSKWASERIGQGAKGPVAKVPGHELPVCEKDRE